MRNRGFTLIELMVSMALFGLIAAGAMTLVMSGARTQSHSARVDVAQTSLRTALDLITRDVMMISSCSLTGNITTSSPSTSTFTAIDLTTATHDNITSGAPYAANTDMLELYNVDGSTVGQVATANSGATTLTVTMEQMVTSSFAATTTPYQSWLQVCDSNSAAIMPLTGVSGSTLTVSPALPASFAANAYAMPSRHVKYYVSDTQFAALGGTAQQNTSMLMMQINNSTPQPLAEGVEDMQIAYGFDNDNSGTVQDDLGAAANGDEWLYNNIGDNTNGTWSFANLRKIRVTLIVKSTTVDTGQQNLPGRPAAEDHTPAGATDGFVRRVLRTEIAVREFNLNPGP